MKAKSAKKETFRVNGTELIKKVKDIINEGNVRRITISDKDGKEIMAFPLTIGVVGALLAPPLAAVGAIAALVTECTITVERK
jgi:hypothetical protein